VSKGTGERRVDILEKGRYFDLACPKSGNDNSKKEGKMEIVNHFSQVLKKAF
jgi:hypothetical protein